MVTFTHEDAGTAERIWADELDRRADLPALDLDGVERVVIVAAHPDDETLGAGGLLAEAAARGLGAEVVLATLGEASHPHSPTHPPARLAELRERESRRAAALLHPDAVVHVVGAPDGRLPENAGRLASALADLRLGTRDLVVAPWEGDRHPDHEAAGAVARVAAEASGSRVLQYPVWLWHWAQPSDAPWGDAISLALTPVALGAKAEALLAHETQIRPLSDAAGDEVLLHAGFLAHFRRQTELYLIPAPGPHEIAPEGESEGESEGARRGESDAAGASHFDRMLEDDPDPWGFETRWYEKRKRALTLASLPDERYRRALEIGCSTGVLSRELAARVDELRGVDISTRALELARRRNVDLPHARFDRLEVPREWPDGRFDLVVISEVGYYLDDAGLESTARLLDGALTAGGVVVACHWRHPTAGRARPGDEVHTVLRAHSGLAVLASHVEEDFLLDVLVRPGRRSVARETGVIG